MLVLDHALKIVLDSARMMGVEDVELTASADRILAADVRSDIDMPPFDKSTRDGYACRRADLASELTVVETIPAGQVPQKSIAVNQCAKIMTGSMMPTGADCVIMVELTENPGAGKVRFTGNRTDDNICLRGEDLKDGRIVLHKGDKIGPQQIAVLATVGCIRPTVFRRPKVGVIATGSELVRPDEKPQGSQIRDSNSWQISAQVERVGGIVNNYGVVPDDKEETHTAICKAATENDVVIVCGGVSVGEYDYVPQILKQSNFELLFEKIAVKPGKPTVFGIRNGTYCFGLPGNPVSAFVIFEILVKPFLYKLMGHDYEPRYVHLELTAHIRRKNTQRLEWIPVLTENDGTAKLIEYHGSAHISAFCGANGLVAVDIGVAEIKKGTVVPVRLF